MTLYGYIQLFILGDNQCENDNLIKKGMTRADRSTVQLLTS